MLTESMRAWRQLSRYLFNVRGVDPGVLMFQVVHSEEADERNLNDPRGFCHVDGGTKIYCAEALEYVIPMVRIGLLLHEAAHLLAPDGMKGKDDAEINADSWILETVPESGYTYLPEYEYIWRETATPSMGVTRVAKNIQVVSPTFVRQLLG